MMFFPISAQTSDTHSGRIGLFIDPYPFLANAGTQYFLLRKLLKFRNDDFFGFARSESIFHPLGPSRQTVAQLFQMRFPIGEQAKMSQSEPVRVDFLDFGNRGMPGFYINIGGRTRWEDRAATDSYAGDIAGKKQALGREPVSIVMLCVIWRLNDPQVQCANLNDFAVLRVSDRILWDSFDRPPEIVHLIPVDPGRASHQPCRIDHVRRSFRMNVDNRAKLFLPAPSSTVVVEVNVCRKKLSNMLGM